MIKLGDIVRDILTGATGVATSRTVGLDGQITFIIEQSGFTEDGEPKDPFYLNAERIEVIDKRDLAVSRTSVATSGGPMPRSATNIE